MNMPLIELTDYKLEPEGTGKGLSGANFSLFGGDLCAIETKLTDDASLFLKALATLVAPVKGTYRFGGEAVDLSHYRNALPCKKRIGYISLDTAMVSNRTIRENLLFMRYYYEDTLSLSLDGRTAGLCRKFGIYDKLDMKPGEVHSQDVLNAITIRELCKAPDVLLLDRPEDVMDHATFDFFKNILEDMLPAKLSVVFFSSNVEFRDAFANRKILIAEGRLSTQPDRTAASG